MSMISAKFAQFLERTRRAPYTTGALVALPLAVVMLLCLIFFEVTILWFFVFVALAILASLKSPFRKMIWTALFLGTYVPVSIWLMVVTAPR